MPRKWLKWAACVIVLVAVVWQFRHEAWPVPLRRAWIASTSWLSSTARSASTRPSSGGVFKCVAVDRFTDQRVLYTNAACPNGMRELAIAGGTFTTLPAPPLASPAGPQASGASLLRKLTGPDGQAIQKLRIEQAIGR